MPIAQTREVTVERDGQLNIDGHARRAGEHVRVFVLSILAPVYRNDEYLLRGIAIEYDRPFDAAVDPNDWEAQR